MDVCIRAVCLITFVSGRYCAVCVFHRRQRNHGQFGQVFGKQRIYRRTRNRHSLSRTSRVQSTANISVYKVNAIVVHTVLQCSVCFISVLRF